VHKSSTVRTAVFMVRTIKLHIWKLCAPFQQSGRQPSRSGRSKPYYGNFMQPKCNRLDAALYGSFQYYFGKAVAVDRPDARSSRPNTFRYFGHNLLLKYRIGTKLALLESLEKIL
jgi:hypothetical protein